MSAFNTITTSAENKVVVAELTRKLNLGAENVIARIAIGYSLSTGEKFKPTDALDSKGKQYSKKTLLGEFLPHYIAMICTHYSIYKTDKDVPKYIKIHLDHGLKKIAQEFNTSKSLTGIDFIFNNVKKGLLFVQ